MAARPTRSRRRTWLLRLAVVGLVAAAAYLARAPILRAMGAELVRTDQLSRAAAIVILAGGVPEREITAADLYREGWAPHVVVTLEPPRAAIDALRRRGVRVPADIDERVRYLTELGVPRSAIVVVDPPIESTRDEAAVVRRWAVPAGATRLIVVTSPFHTARAGFVFDRAFRGAGVSIVMRPATVDAFDPREWWRHRTSLRDGLFEWQKLIFYRVRYCCS